MLNVITHIKMITKKIYKVTRTDNNIRIFVTIVEIKLFGRVFYRKEYYEPFKTNEIFNIKL